MMRIYNAILIAVGACLIAPCDAEAQKNCKKRGSEMVNCWLETPKIANT